jgi:nucleoside-diphosphate-sugar epimerase
MNVFITGGNGFLGDNLLHKLSLRTDLNVSVSVREGTTLSGSGVHTGFELSSETNWLTPLNNKQVVVHTAGRTHVLKEKASDSLSSYWRVNVDGTLNLARQAAVSGVKRFIFISSIKVNGESTSVGELFSADDKPKPLDPYGASKLAAEQGLLEIASETGLELVIIRPPLIYGPSVKGNFARLVKLVKIGVPLPLAGIRNQRSLIAVDNLVDLVITAITHPKAANEVFLASDGCDLSTPELVQGLAQAMNKPSRLFYCAPKVFATGAKYFGKTALTDRLLGSLQVDIAKTTRLLGWVPPVSVKDGLSRCFPK